MTRLDQKTRTLTNYVRTRHNTKLMNEAELDREIERTERQARVLDAAEGRQWFAEMAERDANYCWLMWLKEEREERRMAQEGAA
jgi:hypothetical protein